MKLFVGIVPPPTLSAAITAIQQPFGDNRVEPHITVRAPVLPTDEEKWIKAVETACSETKPFEITLTKTGNFGKRVLFIDVVCEGLPLLYKKIAGRLIPFEPASQHENRPYHPHLTLARSWCGFTLEAFAEMKIYADELLRQETVFTADRLRIYNKPIAGGRWQTFQDIAFTG